MTAELVGGYCDNDKRLVDSESSVDNEMLLPQVEFGGSGQSKLHAKRECSLMAGSSPRRESEAWVAGGVDRDHGVQPQF